MQLQPTERFTDRVQSYQQHRPRYPAGIIDLLADECGLTPKVQIADIAAGTGLLAEIFLANANPVFAVEPNAAMERPARHSQHDILICIASMAPPGNGPS